VHRLNLYRAVHIGFSQQVFVGLCAAALLQALARVADAISLPGEEEIDMFLAQQQASSVCAEVHTLTLASSHCSLSLRMQTDDAKLMDSPGAHACM
jgi:hypothetical protein